MVISGHKGNSQNAQDAEAASDEGGEQSVVLEVDIEKGPQDTAVTAGGGGHAGCGLNYYFVVGGYMNCTRAALVPKTTFA
jgi:hypothetical protein